MRMVNLKLFSLVIVMILMCECKNSNQISNNFSLYPRVQQAYDEKIGIVESLIETKNIDTSSLNIFIRAFKTEKKLELWGKNAAAEKYQLVHTYDVCKKSGDLGPKRREGDYQVPEGVCPFFPI